MDHGTPYSWERRPEYVAAQQYGRCLGRIFRSLPRRVRRRVAPSMTGAALLIAQGIAGFNAELPPWEHLSARDREVFRARALEGIRVSRAELESLRSVRRVSRADLTAAEELMERIEEGVNSADVRPDWL